LTPVTTTASATTCPVVSPVTVIPAGKEALAPKTSMNAAKVCTLAITTNGAETFKEVTNALVEVDLMD